MSDRSRLTDRKQRLPDVRLESESGGPAALVRPGRSVVVLLLHDANCEPCNRYAGEVASSADEIASWGADLVAIPSGTAQPHGPPFRMLRDPENEFDAAAGLARPGILIADEWSDVSLARSTGGSHDFPPVADLVAEVRYLGTRCPECEGESL